MTAEDTTEQRPQSSTGAVPRPRPAAPDTPSRGRTPAKPPRHAKPAAGPDDAKPASSTDATAGHRGTRPEGGGFERQPAEAQTAAAGGAKTARLTGNAAAAPKHADDGTDSTATPPSADPRVAAQPATAPMAAVSDTKIMPTTGVPAKGRHASGRRHGLHRRAAGALGRGVTGVAMGGVQSVWRLSAWRRTPVGGFVVPLLTLLVVVALVAGAGATAQALSHRRALPVAQPQPSTVPSPVSSDQVPEPGNDLPTPTPPAADQPRPVDGLTTWATPLSPTVGISVPALKAYGYAQLSLALTNPGCHLSWTTLAGIGKVESGHGTANGATLQANGVVTPKIIGPALDGTGGRTLVRDTDLGHLDGDATYDRAIGPMQFLPSTWETYQADGDGDGIRDPSDLNDAALAAGNYLCAGGRNLTDPATWWAAILAYNGVPAYAQSVLNAADQYGKLSHTATGTPGSGT